MIPEQIITALVASVCTILAAITTYVVSKLSQSKSEKTNVDKVMRTVNGRILDFIVKAEATGFDGTTKRALVMEDVARFCADTGLKYNPHYVSQKINEIVSKLNKFAQ